MNQPKITKSNVPTSTDQHDYREFSVTCSGLFEGLNWKGGDRLILDGRTTDGDLILLISKGRGRPRLGVIREGQILGDSYEPCSTSRWAVAGRVVAVVGRNGDVRVLNGRRVHGHQGVNEKGTGVGGRRAAVAMVPSRLTPSSRQLSLFAESALAA